MFIHLWTREASPLHDHGRMIICSLETERQQTLVFLPGEALLLLHLLLLSILSRVTSETLWLGECHDYWRITQTLVFRNEFFHPRTGGVIPHFSELISLLWTTGRLGTILTSFHSRYNEWSFSSPLQSFSSSLVLVEPSLTKMLIWALVF